MFHDIRRSVTPNPDDWMQFHWQHLQEKLTRNTTSSTSITTLTTTNSKPIITKPDRSKLSDDLSYDPVIPSTIIIYAKQSSTIPIIPLKVTSNGIARIIRTMTTKIPTMNGQHHLPPETLPSPPRYGHTDKRCALGITRSPFLPTAPVMINWISPVKA